MILQACDVIQEFVLYLWLQFKASYTLISIIGISFFFNWLPH